MAYYKTRYPYLPTRRIVWQEICKYLNRRFIPATSRVLELGCGYGDFIGNIAAKKKAAVEREEFFRDHLRKYGQEIAFYEADALKTMVSMEPGSWDVIFASNFFEHFSMDEVELLLGEVRRLLARDGKLVVIQPNYRLCASLYFDDYTHRSVFSERSFCDLLEACGFDVNVRVARFLPFSFKSSMPVSRALVRLYLSSPVKPLAAQFLVVALARMEGEN